MIILNFFRKYDLVVLSAFNFFQGNAKECVIRKFHGNSQ